MKRIVEYQCEICRSRYDLEQLALNCEARGPGNVNPYPLGLIFMLGHEEITFAIARCSVHRPHYTMTSMWATRDNGAGDNFAEVRCGGELDLVLEAWHKANPEQPTFKRMVDWLRSMKYPVRYWDGTKIIELEKGEIECPVNIGLV